MLGGKKVSEEKNPCLLNELPCSSFSSKNDCLGSSGEEEFITVTSPKPMRWLS